MPVIDLDDKRFDPTLDAGGIVLVDWWAPWCGPCRAFAPVYAAASLRHAGITFAKVNTQDHPGLASAFSVRSIPTLMAFRDGIAVYSQAGAVSAGALDSLVREVRALDMNAVRRQVAAQSKPV